MGDEITTFTKQVIDFYSGQFVCLYELADGVCLLKIPKGMYKLVWENPSGEYSIRTHSELGWPGVLRSAITESKRVLASEEHIVWRDHEDIMMIAYPFRDLN